MNWKYIKQINNEKLIADFEKQSGYSFSDSFKTCIIENNGGRPKKRWFLTAENKERGIKTLLSFNHEDRETVWEAINWLKEDSDKEIIPFGIDDFGNLICFNKANEDVIFYDHEDGSIEHIASSFLAFLECLYE